MTKTKRNRLYIESKMRPLPGDMATLRKGWLGFEKPSTASDITYRSVEKIERAMVLALSEHLDWMLVMTSNSNKLCWVIINTYSVEFWT